MPVNSSLTRDRRISVPIKLAFGSGQAAESIKMTSFDFFLLFYYVQVLNLDAAWAGFALLIALIIDGVTDPVFGAVSDNTKSRWGRRHPFMLLSAIPFGLCFYLLFSPPDNLSATGLFAWLLTFAVGTRVMMTLFLVPYYAVGAEMTEHPGDRTALVAYRTMAAITAAIVLSGVGFSVFFKATAEYPQGQLNPDAYPAFGLSFALLATLAILVSTFGTASQITYLHRRSRERENLTSPGYYVRELVTILKNRSFLAIFLVSITFFILLGVQRALALHMNTYFWSLETQQIQSLFLTFFGATIVFIPTIKFLIYRLDKKRTLYLGLWVILTAFAAPASLRLLGWFPVNASPLLLPLLLVAQIGGGFGTAVLMVCSGSIVADVADDHELRSGKRQEGLLFGFFTLASKSTSGIGSFLAGLTLSAIAFPIGDSVMPGDVDADTLFRLGLAYGPGLLILGLLCVAVMAPYTISRESHARTLDELRRRREEDRSISESDTG